MRAVVADTGPLNYLVLIDLVEILPAFFETVYVPETVQAELSHQETPSVVRDWIAAGSPWLSICPDPPAKDTDLQSLDDGERAAIRLAVVLNADLILMDDRKGMAAARGRGFVVTGTLGLLELAARRRMIDLADAFDRLRRTSFRYHPDLLGALLARRQPG